MSSYPPSVVQHVLDQLDSFDVLELIDYHPESLKREGDTILAWCPICQDHSDRYLAVSIPEKTFISSPPNAEPVGGDLIDLYSRTFDIPYDEALQELADEFAIMVPKEGTDFGKTVKEAEEYLEKARAEEKDRAQRAYLLEQAYKRFRGVADREPENVDALKGIFETRYLENNIFEEAPAAIAAIEVLQNLGRHDEILDIGRRHLEKSPDDHQVRELVAEALMAKGDKESAVSELMQMADTAEQANEFGVALKAYQKVREIGSDIVNVDANIIGILKEQGNTDEAAQAILSRIPELREKKKYGEAMEVAESVLELQPGNDQARLDLVELMVLSGLDEEKLNQSIDHVLALIDHGAADKAWEALNHLSAENPDHVRILELMVNVSKMQGQPELIREKQFRLVEAYQERNDTASAQFVLEEMMLADESDLRPKRLMAELHLKEGDTEEAATMLRIIADALIAEKKWKEAVETFDQLIGIDPENVEARFKQIEALLHLGERNSAKPKIDALADVLEKLNEHKKLAHVLEQVIQLFPGHLAWRRRLADAYQRSGNEKKATEVRLKVVETLIEKEKFDEAEKEAKTLVKFDPANSQALHLLAEALAGIGEKTRAREIFLQLAEVYQNSGQLSECKDVLLSLLESQPDDVEAMARLEEICQKAGDQEGSLDAARRQMETLYKREQLDEARDKAKEILQAAPNDTAALHTLVNICFRRKEKDKALNLSEKLAQVYRDQNKPREERKVLEEIITRYPNYTDALERLVVVLSEMGDEKETKRRLDQLLKVREKSPEANIPFVRDLIARSPSSMPLHELLVSLLKKAGRKDDVIAELQSVVELLGKQGELKKATWQAEQLVGEAPESISSRILYIDLLRKADETDKLASQNLELARLFKKAGKDEEAAGAYERAAFHDPHSEQIIWEYAEQLDEMGRAEDSLKKLCSLAERFEQSGRPEKAVAVLHRVLEAHPENQEVRRAIINVKRKVGGTREVIAELEKLARIQQEQGDVEGAISSRREAIDLAPDDLSLRNGLIEFLEQIQRSTEATEERFKLVDAFAKRKKYDQALKVLEETLKNDPDNILARRQKAKIYDDMGDEKKALVEYRELQSLVERMPAGTKATDSGNGETKPRPVGFIGLQVFPEYTFDRFIVDSHNIFAFSTAKAVAQNPGTERNPLFLYSDVGLGKTHLLHSIANYLKEENPELTILYMSAEDFTSELVEAIQNNTVLDFRHKYRSADVLLLDDVQFLAGKERSQEEFFHIFNTLFQARRQIVLTSDRPPKDISRLDMRLRSRFGQGVIVDIQKPEVETRLAILLAAAKERGIDLPLDALDVLAERISSNVRELKGAFNQLVTYREIGGKEITPDLANQIVDKFYETAKV